MISYSWTVRAKVHINADVPKGYTIYNLITQQKVHDYPTLRNYLLERGIRIGGHEHDGSWEWTLN